MHTERVIVPERYEDGVHVVKLFENEQNHQDMFDRFRLPVSAGAIPGDADYLAVLRRLADQKKTINDVCKHSTPERLEPAPEPPVEGD
jgi:hypothetical protein